MKFEEYKKINELTFDFLSDRYKIKMENLNQINPLVQKFGTDLSKRNNPLLLEIGVGSGSILKYFFRGGFRTWGIDLSSKMIKIAKINSPETYLIHSDFLDYNFNKTNFSGIFADSVLHLFPKKKMKEVFEKIYSLLEDKGYFYFSIPVFDKSSEEIIKRGEDKPFLEFRAKYRQEEIKEIINQTKFSLLEQSIMSFIDSKNNNQSRLNILSKKC
jgi:cyclopropane fatty-acyl-phospholipid synthase-like methyltransferase